MGLKKKSKIEGTPGGGKDLEKVQGKSCETRLMMLCPSTGPIVRIFGKETQLSSCHWRWLQELAREILR
jgi:hypothetical protein